MAEQRAGRSNGAGVIFHCVGGVSGSRGEDVAACSFKTQLSLDMRRAEEVPLHARCQRQGCRQLWPAVFEEDFL